MTYKQLSQKGQSDVQKDITAIVQNNSRNGEQAIYDALHDYLIQDFSGKERRQKS